MRGRTDPVDVSRFRRDANLVAGFLALRDIADWAELSEPADLIVLLGCSTLVAAEAAASGFLAGKASRLLVSGGIGHATEWLYSSIEMHPRYRSVPTRGRPEAAVLRDVLEMNGIDPSRVLIEDRSTNCGANAVESRKLLDDMGVRLETVVLIQDPTMQRRTDASFRHAWSESGDPLFVNFAPFVPQVGPEGLGPDVPGLWPAERFLSLILGEIPRLRDAPGGYGPKGAGFIAHVDIPEEVEAAWARLAEALPDLAGR